MSHAHGKMRHHLSAGANPSADYSGWMEGLTSLGPEDKATALTVLTSEPATRTPAANPAAASGPDTALSTSTSTPLPAPAATSSSSATALSPIDAAQGDAGPSNSLVAANAVAAASMPAANLAALTPSMLAPEGPGVLDTLLEVIAKELEDVGECVFALGGPASWGPQVLTEDQTDSLLAQVGQVAVVKDAQMTQLRRRTAQVQTPNGPVDTVVADVLVRKGSGPQCTPIEVRVAIIGNVDSGKSTLVGVLTRTMLDDGRGLARSKVFKHHHEETTGRTSSIGQHNMCLDGAGNVLNDTMFRNQTCGDYVQRAAKVLTLVDLAGHERYFRTTAYGLTGHMPDYACLVVGANMGIVGMCKEHLGVALALKIPIMFIITKVDICPEHILKQTVQTLTTILKKPGLRRKPFLVRSMDDVLLCARHFVSDSLAPVFLTSAVTGKGLDLVRALFNLLPIRQRWGQMKGSPAEFLIDETFTVPGVGTVVAGTVKRGSIYPNSQLMLGPDVGDGSFNRVAVKSIHYKRLPVQQVVAGQTAALAIKKIKRNQVRKGMVLVDESLKPKATWEFDADCAILTHSTTIQPRYQAVIHAEIIRQAARVVAMDVERLRSGDRACVRFRFIQRPEYLTLNTRFVFREGRTKGIGIVIGTEHEVLPDDQAQLQARQHAQATA